MRIMDKLLTSDEVADILRISLRTLYNWRVRRYGPRGLKVGGSLVYRERDIEAWLDSPARGRTRRRIKRAQ